MFVNGTQAAVIIEVRAYRDRVRRRRHQCQHPGAAEPINIVNSAAERLEKKGGRGI